MPRLSLPFKSRSKKFLVLIPDSIDSAGFDGPESSWLRKSLVSGTAGLGGFRDGFTRNWLSKSLVSGSVGCGEPEFNEEWSADWCGREEPRFGVRVLTACNWSGQEKAGLGGWLFAGNWLGHEKSGLSGRGLFACNWFGQENSGLGGRGLSACNWLGQENSWLGELSAENSKFASWAPCAITGAARAKLMMERMRRI